jgi:hypothetical protein
VKSVTNKLKAHPDAGDAKHCDRKPSGTTPNPLSGWRPIFGALSNSIEDEAPPAQHRKTPQNGDAVD